MCLYLCLYLGVAACGLRLVACGSWFAACAASPSICFVLGNCSLGIETLLARWEVHLDLLIACPESWFMGDTLDH